MVAVVVLAAGRGTRMKSRLPKVLHELGGRTLLERVLDSVADLNPTHQVVVVGYGREAVEERLQSRPGIQFVHQAEQLGTGHAVQQVMPHLEGYSGDVLVLSGDVPMLRSQTLAALLHAHQHHGNAATVLTAQLPDPTGYGRVFCDAENILTEILEDRDCTPSQRQNHRINAGVYCFRWPDLAQVLPKLSADNDQEEYYLTDVVRHLHPVMAVNVADYQEIQGINSRQQLAAAYAVLQDRVKKQWMEAGVTLVDPDSITIDETVQLEMDVVIEPQTHLRGDTYIKTGSRIGPGSLVENSQLGENVTVLYSVVLGSVVADNTCIGPYTHLRGEVEIGQGCRIGNFVELKKTSLGDRTNVAHLSYIGNATLGNRVNVGAGTITANYDGFNKHPTVIGDRTKTGANSVLVAPITIGAEVTIGAGSVITRDVPDDCLVVSRAKQKEIPGWRPPHLRSTVTETPSPSGHQVREAVGGD